MPTPDGVGARRRAWARGAAAAVLIVCTVLSAPGCAPPSTAPPVSSPAPLASGSALAASPVRERLAAVDSWALAIGDGALDGPTQVVADRLGVFDLVVVDGEEATAEQVAALRARGTLVLGYLSVGTIEPWRSWYENLRPFALERWDDWSEYYADVGDPAYRAAVGRIAATILGKGLDGLFIDNVDMVGSHPEQVEGMRRLVSALSRLAREGGGVLFAQNGDHFCLTAAALLDGWNREDVTFAYDFDTGSYVRTAAAEHTAALAAVASMRAAGVFVTTTDYVAVAGSPEEAEALEAGRGVGALPYVADIELARVPARPF